MTKRFFIQGPLTTGTARLEGTEAHHLIHVLRIDVGQVVTLFDGCALEATAQVIDITNSGVDLAIQELRAATTESTIELVLAAAVPKGDRFGWLIEKATELGVRRFVPLITSRSVVIPGEGKLDKMRRTIVEASKQCGRTRLMELAAPRAWPDFVAGEFASRSAWVAHPAGVPFEVWGEPSPGPVVTAVGPEGGFTDAELELAAQAGAKQISLGPHVLRIETAALVLAAVFTISRRTSRSSPSLSGP
jgi:16S rRNA (uracil1498-N3)-methyltransferase